MSNDRYIPMPVRGPYMNQSVPSTKVEPGSFGYLAGVDGRFGGTLRKFYGMERIVRLGGITATGTVDDLDKSGVVFCQAVSFRGSGSTVYSGYVIMWDKLADTTDMEVALVYTDNYTDLTTTTWTVLTIYASGAENDIASTDHISCDTYDAFVYVAVEGQTPQTIYYNGSAVVSVDMGCGVYTTLPTMARNGVGVVDSSYYLRGNGTYQVAFRFYDSTRGIYSGLSTPVTFTLDNMKLTKATGSVGFAGRPADTGTITINGRVYEFDSDDTTTGDVAIDVSGSSTLLGDIQAAADAINGDSSAVVSARASSSTLFLEAKDRGSTANGYTLAVSGANLVVSGTNLTGGGASTAEPETNVKQVLDFPDTGAESVPTGYRDLFDKIDVYRSIDLGSATGSTQGAILYREQTIDMPEDDAGFDALQATVGTVLDEALVFYPEYDPEKDVVQSPPTGGLVKRYQGVTFMSGAAASTNRGKIFHSRLDNTVETPETFTTYNEIRLETEEGVPRTLVRAGDSAFLFTDSSITHVYKGGPDKPLQLVTVHSGIGVAGPRAAHSTGNSVVALTTAGLAILNGHDGSLGMITAADRTLYGTWAGSWDAVKSAYDAQMNASFFLLPSRSELLVIWHSTQAVTVIEGANFVDVSSGQDFIAGDGKLRAHLVTSIGIIVQPDYARTATGTMTGLTTGLTLNGALTAATTTTLTCDGATFNSTMRGSLVYITSGALAGESRVITSNTATELTVVAFGSTPAAGDTFAISPVPFKVRFPRIQEIQGGDSIMSQFFRRVLRAATMKFQGLSGFTNNTNNFWRLGVYRHGSTSLEATLTSVDMDENPADSVGVLNIDGVDLEPYIEQIASGVDFELTNAEVAVTMTTSRNVS